MKYKITIAAVAVLFVLILINAGNSAFGNVAGAPSGATGSPGDGVNNTCGRSGCHTGSAVTSQANWITSTIPAAGYTPGATYTITATATYAGAVRFGFEISPQDISGNYMGTLVVTSSTTTQIIGGKYMTHKSAGTTGSTGSHVWTFNWTAPVSGSGPVTFYGSFNCTNNDTHDTGDHIYTSNLAVTEKPTDGLDCGIFSITAPAVFGCDSTITPTVVLKNYGTTTLDSVNINYFADANSPMSYTYIGTLATSATATITLPSISIPTGGAHTFTATTLNPNGINDTLTANDSKTNSFNLVFAGVVLPFSQGFESTTFPPTGWIRNNPDNSTTWARSTAAHKTGVASAYMNNYNYASVNQIDELISPAIDLTTDAAPNLTFQVAYRLYDNPSSSAANSDTLSVFISTDCGITWQRIYYKYGVALTTITPAYSTAVFTPNATQWRQESINLLPYATCKTAYLKFRNTNEYENQLYLDDIYINGPAGISDPSSFLGAIDLFPNPSTDLLTVNYLLKENSDVNIQIFNMEGKAMDAKKSEGIKSPGNYSEVIDVKNYPSGIYFMHMSAGNLDVTRKFMVMH
jgi:hypothetical protein